MDPIWGQEKTSDYKDLLQGVDWGIVNLRDLSTGLAQDAASRVHEPPADAKQAAWELARKEAALANVLAPERNPEVVVPYMQLFRNVEPELQESRLPAEEVAQRLLAASQQLPDTSPSAKDLKVLLLDLATQLDARNTAALMAYDAMEQQGIRPDWGRLDPRLLPSGSSPATTPHPPGESHPRPFPSRPTYSSHAAPEPAAENKTAWNGNTSSKIQVLMVQRPQSGGPQVGLVNDMILTVESGLKNNEMFAKFNQKVGDDMTTALQEAVRLAKVRQKSGGTGLFAVLGFEDKYVPKDGGSAGTACALLLCAVLEGFEIDPACALTGDITADGVVRKVGAIPCKLDGAVQRGARYVAIPEENREVVDDLVLLGGREPLLRTNLFAIGTLEDALWIAKAGKSPKYIQAIETYETVARDLRAHKAGRDLKNPAVQEELRHVAETLPNHLGAWYLLRAARNNTRDRFSFSFSAEQIFSRAQTFLPPLMDEQMDQSLRGRDVVVKSTYSREICEDTLRGLNELNFKVDPRTEELLTEMIRYVDVWRRIAEIPGANNNSPVMRQRRDEMMQSRSKIINLMNILSLNEDFMKELVQK